MKNKHYKIFIVMFVTLLSFVNMSLIRKQQILNPFYTTDKEFTYSYSISGDKDLINSKEFQDFVFEEVLNANQLVFYQSALFTYEESWSTAVSDNFTSYLDLVPLKKELSFNHNGFMPNDLYLPLNKEDIYIQNVNGELKYPLDLVSGFIYDPSLSKDVFHKLNLIN